MLRITLRPLVVALAFALPVTAASAAAESWPSFGTQGTQFVRDGKPYQILSGAIHFQRIPRQYWKDRLQKARALGLNTVETYVFWNLVEPQQGRFDFTANNDIAAFVREAAAQGLNVILRPGPYTCAEWEAGGYPAWLFGMDNIRVRSRDPRFLAASQAYLHAVARQVHPLLNHNGGPIIAVQVENEYGSYDDDHAYMADNRAMYVKAGFDDALLFTSDGADMLANGTLPDTLAVVNFAPGEAKSAFDKLIKFRPDQPRMAGEYWAGWFDHWGEPHASTDARQQTKELEWILRQGHSANLYMFIGGTSFGFMNGANFQGNPGDHYAPQTTSYDYDAILDEAGRPTPKFALMRDAITCVTGVQPPALPTPIATVALPEIPLRESASLWDNLPAPIAIDTPQPMEHFGQDYGYILYRTTVTGPRKGTLYLGQVRDVARVYLDQNPVGSVERRLQQVSTHVDIPAGQHTLNVLVENSGRINYGPRMADGRAGLVDPVLLDNQLLTGWQAFPLPMRSVDSLRGWTVNSVQGPAFHRGTLRIGIPSDTYLDMRAFGKGVTWANGINLGRHWTIGPQRALYFPAPLQRKGDNAVVVFDLDSTPKPSVRGLNQQVWITPKE
ncbi:beta-galactosidase family protein [Xanthomonas fragariae]|uniref:Beta-galactosidase n=1 Tax=Xanthomonas fragariae TaxID=48664 RepID=A0A1Y6HQ94_9XANT|nr:beta-galactosidase [Xanthomonas fragariae]AOD15831.1 beta-galactosidase [Xanthomonas fragariae]AOD19251.1 beta-galactosidase [Xanthomonas fragariae]ENZ93690.1 beta-galactosidase [Xanthomonas fragariae LMG 25863]MBL9198185.1 beta-galactosidase [Xanthomonas fragariae]MBL9221168.1 beta-galactosidase [Xanthomonas fragariae]